MTARNVLRAAAVAALCLAPAGAAAQSRDQQVLADLRMVQEQVQQLRLSVAQLAAETKALVTKLDSQTEDVRKASADQLLTVRELLTKFDALAERVYQNTTQAQLVKDELNSLRQGQSMLQQQMSQIFQQLLALTSVAPQTDPTGRPVETTAGGGGGGTLPSSPEALFNSAHKDYILNQYQLAIDGFEEFIQSHPQSPRAAEAQYLIGESLFRLGKYTEALAAFGVVTSKYATATAVPGAYFRQGNCYEQLKKKDDALRVYRLVAERFPNSTEGIMAKGRITALGGGE
jgi:tol-pal system protein YbgF